VSEVTSDTITEFQKFCDEYESTEVAKGTTYFQEVQLKTVTSKETLDQLFNYSDAYEFKRNKKDDPWKCCKITAN